METERQEMKRWPTKLLGEIAEVRWGNTSLTKTSYVAEGFSAFSATGEDGFLPSYEHEEAGIVLSAIGANCGKCFLAKGRWTAIKNTITITSPAEELCTIRYLFYFLNNVDLWPKRGGGQPFISQGDARKVIVPVAPLAEQERLVKLLDEADELRKLRAQADRRTADLIPSLFHEMFGDLLKKTLRFQILPLGEVVDFGSGATPSKENPEFWNGNTPWVSPKDMKAEELTDTEDHVSTAAFEKSNLQLISKDTVLIVVHGMILAHTVPIRLCRVPVAINQDMKALLPKQPIDPEFLRWSLQAQHSHLLSQVSTAGHGTKKLDSDRLRAVTVPVPPLPQQKEFAARVTEIRAMQAEQATSRRRLDDLFHSMLHRAFQGEL